MPAPVTVDLSGSLGYAGPWPVLDIAGATGIGTGSLVNATYLLLEDLLNGGNQWENGTQTITRHTNGDWLIKSGATVYYRKTGSVTYPWSAGTWTSENGAGGTPVLTWRTPDPIGIDREGTAYDGDPPVAVDFPSSDSGSSTELVISGVSTAGVNGTWPFKEIFSGRPLWAKDNPDPDDIYVTWDDGVWRVANYNDSYFAEKVSTANTPNELTGWTVSIGTGQPVITTRINLPVTVTL